LIGAPCAGSAQEGFVAKAFRRTRDTEHELSAKQGCHCDWSIFRYWRNQPENVTVNDQIISPTRQDW